MTDRELLVWMAGFFDGEGSIAIQVLLPGKYRRTPLLIPHLAVKIKYGTDVLQRFVDRFGGKIYSYANRQGDSWNLMGVEKIKATLEALLPYLAVKRQIAERMLEALEHWPDLKGVNRYGGERAWSDEATAAVMEIAISLNPPSTKNAKQKLHAKKVQAYVAQLRRKAA